MKKFLLLVAIGYGLFAHALFACDFCNCVSGINPYYNGKNRLAINFLSQRSFLPPTLPTPLNTVQTKHHALPSLMHGGHGASPFPTTETRQTLELMLQHHLSEHFMLTALVPFSTLTIEQGSSFSVSGIGDITLMAHYVFDLPLFERSTLLLGGGVKTPTGLSNLTDASSRRFDTRFQSGSGSWDFVFNPMFIAQQSGFTYAIDVFMKLNTKGTVGDRIGHSLSATTTLSHDVFRSNPSQTALVGMFGARFEAKTQDWISSQFDRDSDFASFYAQVGVQVVFYFVKIDALALVPLHQSRSTLAMNEETRFLMGARVEF